MKPPILDWRSVRAKLRRIEDLLETLQSLGKFDAERLRHDLVPTLAAERILTLVVETAFSTNSHVAVTVLRRAPDSYAESFNLAAKTGMIGTDLADLLIPSAKLRNMLVHDYGDVDLERLASAIPLAIEQYGRYVREAAKWLVERQKVSGGT